MSKPQLRRFSLRREYLNMGGYDSGGQYWGQGEPLYRYDSDDMVDWGHLRALTRLTAIQKLRSLHPEASVRGDAVLGRTVSSRASGYGLWPLVRDQLSCPGCGSQNGILLTGCYAARGTGPGGRGRLGDPGALDWAECKRCGRRGYLVSRKEQE